ncbi:helix-turn-helix domain-containing protein [Peribacillus frigoritolerans]|uniref:helix-turn-helix domain-containing protein n=1 Tax=Peribacillus frigoritolerans TaxID=450367 RepID=UPI00203B23F6|nr:transcriptional regulator [Peribacillus frigoritolerans]MCM3167925.1 transcriptional regulator [Peribacillus frigoritolerans]
MMLEHLGQQIRQLRVRKGKGLNEFAKELHVSAGYLSNLETGKSETIKLDILEKIQEELKVLPIDSMSSFSQRMKRIEQDITELEKKDPLYAEFLLQNIENSIEWFKERTK